LATAAAEPAIFAALEDDYAAMGGSTVGHGMEHPFTLHALPKHRVAALPNEELNLTGALRWRLAKLASGMLWYAPAG